MDNRHPLEHCAGASTAERRTYPLIKCDVTGELQPGYALCPHLAEDVTLQVGDMAAPTKKSMGVIVCRFCVGRSNVALVVCCGPCVEAGLLKGMAQA